MPNMDGPLIHVNKDIVRRVEGIFIFWDFTEVEFPLRSQFNLTGLSHHAVLVVTLICEISMD